MNRYNPYTVPEGFFDNLRQEAMAARARYRRTVRMVIGTAAVALILLVTPFILNLNSEEDTEITASYQDRLADNYSNDMFLLVSFE